MRIIEQRVYVGPNLYANFKVIRLLLDLGVLEQHPSAEIDGFVDRLVQAMPSLGEHGCSYRTEGGFIRRMREDRGTWMGHILEHVALELQATTLLRSLVILWRAEGFVLMRDSQANNLVQCVLVF